MFLLYVVLISLSFLFFGLFNWVYEFNFVSFGYFQYTKTYSYMLQNLSPAPYTGCLIERERTDFKE